MPERDTERFDITGTTYANASLFEDKVTVCVCVVRLSMGPLWRMLGGENVSVMSKAAWRTQWELCTCARLLQEKVNEW